MLLSMTVFTVTPEQAALVLPALRGMLPAAKATSSVQALATYLRVAGGTGYRLIGSFDAYQGTSAPALAVLGYRITPTLAHGRLLEISELYVLPEARGEGHRLDLLRWVKHEGKLQGCTTMQLTLGLLESPEDTALYNSVGLSLAGKYYTKELRPL